MAQVVSFWPLTAEAQVHVGFVVDKGTRADFPVNIILSWLSILVYHLRDEE
jgi:hypothetical protein